MTSLKVMIGGIPITNGKKLLLVESQKKLRIEFNHSKNKYFAIIMIDPDAPSSSNPIFKYWIHLLVVNNNRKVVKYHPPSPPKGSGEHRYYIYLLQQSYQIDENDPELLERNRNRGNFNLSEFLDKYQLKEIESIYFITENP